MAQTSSGARPGIKLLEIRKRSALFQHYKSLTGGWPVLSVAMYVGRFLLMFALITALFWYGRQHPEKANRVTLYALLGFLPIIFVWNILETVTWNHELRRKGLSDGSMYLTLTQIPAEIPKTRT